MEQFRVSSFEFQRRERLPQKALRRTGGLEGYVPTPTLALLPIGAYFPDSYRSVHTSSEEELRGFLEVGAQWMVPMHYGTFRLGREPMDEPLEWLRAESDRLGLGDRIKVLSEGETLRL